MAVQQEHEPRNRGMRAILRLVHNTSPSGVSSRPTVDSALRVQLGSIQVGAETQAESPTGARPVTRREIKLLIDYNKGAERDGRPQVIFPEGIDSATTRLRLVPQQPEADEPGENLYASPFPPEAEEKAQAVKAFVAEHPGATSAVGAVGLETLSLIAEQQANLLSSHPPTTSLPNLFSYGEGLQWIEQLTPKGLWEIGGQVAHIGAIGLASLAAIHYGIKIFRHFFPAHQEEPATEE